MARIASVQVAGYFPTPPELLTSFASTFRWREKPNSWRQLSILDPCAGEGEAVRQLRDAFLAELGCARHHIRIVANELEGERARRLARNLRSHDEAIHADAFHLHWSDEGARATLLYLNPPYDFDPRFGRLEQRFLERFAPAIDPGTGVLFYRPPGTL